MDKREDALQKALQKNEEEVERWEAYVKDNETAIENLNMFSKKLTVDVMVPIGTKAFMPGQLIHTNEVLVGHYQDYFSKCSAYTAVEICKKRVEKGKSHLEQLEVERDLFQNKLDKPHLDGVLPNSEEREIIEEYDEEQEKVWREKHRQRVKEAKLKEKQDRDALNEKLNEQSSVDEIVNKLEEEEIFDEISEQLGQCETEESNNTAEILRKLMSGEMNLPPPKERVVHSDAENRGETSQLKSFQSKKNIQPLELNTNSISESSETQLNFQLEDNASNPEISEEYDIDSSSSSEDPEEIRLIQGQAGFLPQNDQLGFYRYQLKIINQKIGTSTFSNNKEMEEKLHLFKVRDYLEDLVEMHEGWKDGSDSESEFQEKGSDEEKDAEEKLVSDNRTRRISFALEDQFVEFRRNEAVAQMIPPKKQTEKKTEDENTSQRDIIRLDDSALPQNESAESGTNNSQVTVDRRKTILEKVEENIKTLSLENVDLVNKIIDSSQSRPPKTLRINFKHSNQIAAKSDDGTTDIPASPSDLYKHVYKDATDIQPSSDNKKTKLIENEKAYVDVRSEYFTPEPQSKSILKNKSAVELETHIKVDVQKQQKTTPKKATKSISGEEDEYLSAYNKVMSDVIENATLEPDPLPQEKFVDMHAPKKRVSRFKQMRSESKA